ncbi:MAG: YbgC/FadM family acyl-CoA thioesterase [Rhodospirillaceae bacterium]|nr:YbgC/FadM family acyl-CoA thioesterase [Rhodospirillaceae bacterium]
MSESQKIHTFPVRIYFEDTDAGGIVYHSRYLNYCERARAELLRECGIESRTMMKEHKCGFAVRHVEIDFLKPAHLDEELIIESRLIEMKGASSKVSHLIRHKDDLLVDIKIVLVCMGPDERPVRIPDPIRKEMVAWQ